MVRGSSGLELVTHGAVAPRLAVLTEDVVVHGMLGVDDLRLPSVVLGMTAWVGAKVR
jgi:hypothetical protein